MSGPVVLLEVNERGVATLTLNRPEVNNVRDRDGAAGWPCGNKR